MNDQLIVDRELKEFLFNSSLDQLTPSDLSQQRIRFVQKAISTKEAREEFWPKLHQLKKQLKENTAHAPYAEQVFFRPTESGLDLLIPVTGPKTASSSEYQILDLSFPKLGTLVLPSFLAERAQISDFLRLCRELETENPGDFLKKILVELNSKDLALHFFL